MEKLDFWPATVIGIGAIVGGGIFVLGGTAFVEAGPAAVLAFTFNGILALITARSYATLSRVFPESGGTYVYAKRILSVRAAFVVGWMLWLAHLVAALLYAIGFSSYLVSAIKAFLTLAYGSYPSFLSSWGVAITFSAAACAYYTHSNLKQLRSGGIAENVLKLVLFAGLVGAGLFACFTSDFQVIQSQLSPFAPMGLAGIAAAMGYTFIAFQGFELIAAASGEIKNPTSIVPKAMYRSLQVGMLVYVPLLLIIVVVGVSPGTSIVEACQLKVDTCIADAAEVFLGPIGFWVVTLAAIFATLSALQANLVASSSIARTMAVDRTMPRVFGQLHERFATPEVAILSTFVIVLVMLIALPNAAAAGSAASLAFLICFTFTHGLSFLSLKRDRSGRSKSKTINQLFAGIGAAACASLAVFQLSVESSAGTLLLAWVGLGGLLYYVFLSRRAEALDAFSSARDGSLAVYRGKIPVVLVPISNPSSAEALSSTAAILAPSGTGRVLFLSVASTKPGAENFHDKLRNAADNVTRALLNAGENYQERIEGIVSTSSDPWNGIAEIARTYGCEILLLGFNSDGATLPTSRIKSLFGSLHMNIVILGCQPGWTLSSVKRVVVPVGGRGEHDRLRARVLGGITANSEIQEICFLRILPSSTSPSSAERVRRALEIRALDETPRFGKALVECSDDVGQAILDASCEDTLILLGLSSQGGTKNTVGPLVTKVANSHKGATLIIRHSAK